VSAEDVAVALQGAASGSVSTLSSDDDLLDALDTERAARARAERLYAEADASLAKAQREARDLLRLRDNFHSLYREERELRAEAERVAEEHSIERDGLEAEIIVLRADVDRLDRLVKRYQAARAERETAAADTAATDRAVDTRVHELERDTGMLRAHAAELEAAVGERTAALTAANQRVADLEREVAMARAQLAGSEPAGESATSANAEELAASVRRIHDLEGELATLTAEHADLRAAHDRAAGARDEFKRNLSAALTEREEAQRFVASAEQRLQVAVTHEQEAARAAGERQAAAERAEQDLQVARATISVLEQRVHEAEQARATAEQRSTELAEELGFVRSDVLNGTAQPSARRNPLRRRPAEAGRPGRPGGPHIEAIGTAVGNATPVEVTGTPEDVESALHRRLFGGQ